MTVVSIIIPAWNDDMVLEKTLNSLFNVDYSSFEVIVIAGGNDRTLELAENYAKKYTNCVVIEQEPKGKNAAIISGLKKMNKNTDIIILLDADTVVSKNWLKIGIDLIVKEGFDALNGDYYPIKMNYISSYFMFEKIRSCLINKNHGLYGGGSIFLKVSILEEFPVDELFDEKVYVGVDHYLCEKLKSKNYKVGFAKGAKVKTHIPTNMKDFVKVERRWIDAWVGLSKNKKEFEMMLFKDFLIVLSLIMFVSFFLIKNYVLSVSFGSVFILFLLLNFLKGLNVYLYTKDITFLKYLPTYILINVFYCFLRLFVYSKIKLFGSTVVMHFKGERPK